MINVSVLGYGTVGSGVVEILKENADLITKRRSEEHTSELQSRE